MSEKNYITSNVIEYDNISRISGYTCIVKNETDTTYYNKEFRTSFDKILWYDYKELTNKNLSKVNVGTGNKFYIQYRFTKVGDDDVELSVESISLDVDYTINTTSPIPECYWYTQAGRGTGGNCCKPQIVYDCGCGSSGNTFNPYAMGNSLSIYQQLCSLVSNMFGMCVTYYKTKADARSRDVVLKEYSLENVVDKDTVKVLIPDNQLPTREIQFNSMMMDYPVQFEVHIVKQEFWSKFGEDSHPDPHDYMYFQVYMNKMYRVDSVSEADDFGYMGAYWRVSLTPYENMSSIGYEDDTLKEETESLIFSAEGKFEEETKEEFEDNRKDNQLNDMGDLAEGQDFLRRVLNPNVRIVEEKIYNDYTMVSDRYYNMSTIDKGDIAVEYKYTEGFSSDDTIMFSFFMRPMYTDKNISENILIKSIENNDGKIRLRLKGWNNNIEVGNYVKITKAGSANGYRKITYAKKSGYIVDVDGDYDSECTVINCSKVVVHDVNEILRIRNDSDTLMSVEQTPTNIQITLNGERHEYSFNFEEFEEKWYAVLIGINSGRSNIWLYEINGSEKKENNRCKLKLVDVASSDTGSFDFGDTCYYDLISGRYNVTNFRMWDKLCEESLHNVILSQFVIDDTHNTLIVDNAKNELLVNYKWS